MATWALFMRARRRTPRTGSEAELAASRPGDVDAGGTDIHIEYAVHPRPRFGEHWGLPRNRPLHAVLAGKADVYGQWFDVILRRQADLLRIPRESESERDPRWVNLYLPGLDTAALYAFTVERAPSLYVEVGSGNSTRVVRRAIDDHGLTTQIVSIDPQPRAVCDELCDEIVRKPLEDADLAVFDRLQAGDICFIDNSHCAFQNSDVTVVFLEVLPRLRPGVLVGIHDIWLPDDYPAAWADRWYSEQYLLASLLLGGADPVDIVFPAWHIANDPAFADRMARLWDLEALHGVERHGHAFWMLTKD